jgi:hypothetical protein
VGEAVEAARLLLAEDPDEAAALAGALDAANLTRRDITKQVLADARLALVDGALESTENDGDAAALVASAPAVIVQGPWPVGIVGSSPRASRRNRTPGGRRGGSTPSGHRAAP